MTILGLHTFALAPSWDIARIEPELERLLESGIRLLEVPFVKPGAIDAARARSFALHWGIELFVSTALPGSINVVDAPADGIAFLEPALQLAAEVGSFGLGGMTYAAPGATTGRPATGREIDGVCRFLDRAARTARGYGVRIGIEPCNRYETHLVNTARDAARIIERIGADNIFIHLDSYHMHQEEEGFEPAFAEAEPFLGYVQVSESNRGLPGRGTLDWAACMKGIEAVGYRGPITLECPVRIEGQAAATAAIWRPAVGRFDDLVEIGLPHVRRTAKAAGLDLG